MASVAIAPINIAPEIVRKFLNISVPWDYVEPEFIRLWF